MELEDSLRMETEKWLNRLEGLDISGEEDFVRNIKAYISDARHFLEKEDLIRAFEAVIWAWAWYEIGKEIGKVADESS